MATPSQVRQYLALWFQLGRHVILPQTGEALLPQPVFRDGTYSPEFEACWKQVQEVSAQMAYLEGTPQTIGDLLSIQWDILPCSRCEMPVPVIDLGLPLVGCPCQELLSWPNLDIPRPRSAIDSQQQLQRLQSKLQRLAQPEDETNSQVS